MNNMAPNEQGRHCAQCCKTVIDFTGMEPEEIAGYLQAQQHQNVCGRFRGEQVETVTIRPEVYINQLQQMALPFLKRIAAIFLFVFCLSAQAGAQGQQQQQPVTEHPRPVMGKVAPARVIADTVGKPLQPVKTNDERYMMGRIASPQPVKGNTHTPYTPSSEKRKQQKHGHS